MSSTESPAISSSFMVPYRDRRLCSGATFPVLLMNCHGGSARIVENRFRPANSSRLVDGPGKSFRASTRDPYQKCRSCPDSGLQRNRDVVHRAAVQASALSLSPARFNAGPALRPVQRALTSLRHRGRRPVAGRGTVAAALAVARGALTDPWAVAGAGLLPPQARWPCDSDGSDHDHGRGQPTPCQGGCQGLPAASGARPHGTEMTQPGASRQARVRESESRRPIKDISRPSGRGSWNGLSLIRWLSAPPVMQEVAVPQQLLAITALMSG
jgi:hypothetical protein